MKIAMLKILLATIIISTIGSCRKESDDDAGGTATKAMAGEWWIQLSIDNELLLPDYFKILTYNTSENVNTKMWLDDLEQLWPFKIKIDVNPVNKTFSANASESLYSEITVNLQNGKILPGASVGPFSKAVTDSIYVEAEFSDDPGTIYQLSGYRRTKFQEDDH